MSDKYGLTLQDRLAAEKNNISYMTLRARMQRGWSKEKAINGELENKAIIKKYQEKAEKNGISKYTFRMRYYKLGWDLEKASTKKPGGKTIYKYSYYSELEYKGEIHTLKEWSIIIDIPADTLRDRLRKGWSTEKMLTTPRRKYERKI